eukprot:SAG22_NODE_577_length_8975_cov_12.406827_9_plen_185_part_00
MVDRLGLHRQSHDLRHPTPGHAPTSGANTYTGAGGRRGGSSGAAAARHRPGDTAQQFGATADAAKEMQIAALEQQLNDVRSHYIKKVRELHKKLEHYEYGGGSSDLALRDMEGVLESRDRTVMQQSRAVMDSRQKLVSACCSSRCSHPAHCCPLRYAIVRSQLPAEHLLFRSTCSGRPTTRCGR